MCLRWRFKILDLAPNGHFQPELGLIFSRFLSTLESWSCPLQNCKWGALWGRGGGYCRAADNLLTITSSLSPPSPGYQFSPGHYIQTLWTVSHAKSYLSHYLYDLKTISELILRDTNGLHVCNIILGSGTQEKNLLLNFKNVLMKSNNGERRGLTNWLYILTHNMCQGGRSGPVTSVTSVTWGMSEQSYNFPRPTSDWLPGPGMNLCWARVTTLCKKGHKTSLCIAPDSGQNVLWTTWRQKSCLNMEKVG